MIYDIVTQLKKIFGSTVKFNMALYEADSQLAYLN